MCIRDSYIGTWIETNPESTEKKLEAVVPYIGTWIETIEQYIQPATWSTGVVPYIGTWIETIDHFLGEYCQGSYLI